VFSKKTVKVLSIVLILAVCMEIFAGCAQSPVDAYDNFLLDLDIVGRLHDLNFLISRGKHSIGVRSELHTIWYDLDTLKTDVPDIMKANDYYKEATDALLQAANANYYGHSDVAREFCTQAAKLMSQADIAFRNYMRTQQRKARDDYFG